MKDMEKIFEAIEQELNKIVERGFNTSNLDHAYKLVDMYKDLKNSEYWETKGEYYMTVLDEMQGGYAEGNYPMMEDGYAMRGRKRDRMERYSLEDGMMNDNMSYARGGRGGNRGYSNNEGMMHDRYMDAKQSYRSNKSMDGKQRLMDSLEEYMDEFTEKIKEMARDSDFPEEKEMINKFIGKLQTIR